MAVVGQGATLRASLLPLIDSIRGLPALMGFRPHILTVRVQQWTSAQRPGPGAHADTNTGIKVDLSIGNVKVRNVTQRDIVASGGIFTDQDVVVGPFTPPYPGSFKDNDAIAVFDPPVSATPTTVLYNIQGPGYSATGDWFKKIYQRVDQPLHYTLWLRKTGQVMT
jgi:hypothetical protein